MNHETEQQIAADLVKCDIGMAMTTGRVRAKYVRQRRKIFSAIHEENIRDGLDHISDADLLAELFKESEPTP
jgi:hypothetical protein